MSGIDNPVESGSLLTANVPLKPRQNQSTPVAPLAIPRLQALCDVLVHGFRGGRNDAPILLFKLARGIAASRIGKSRRVKDSVTNAESHVIEGSTIRSAWARSGMPFQRRPASWITSCVNLGLLAIGSALSGRPSRPRNGSSISIGDSRLGFVANINYTVRWWPALSFDLADTHFSIAPGTVDNGVYTSAVTLLKFGNYTNSPCSVKKRRPSRVDSERFPTPTAARPSLRLGSSNVPLRVRSLHISPSTFEGGVFGD